MLVAIPWNGEILPIKFFSTKILKVAFFAAKISNIAISRIIKYGTLVYNNNNNMAKWWLTVLIPVLQNKQIKIKAQTFSKIK